MVFHGMQFGGRSHGFTNVSLLVCMIGLSSNIGISASDLPFSFAKKKVPLTLEVHLGSSSTRAVLVYGAARGLKHAPFKLVIKTTKQTKIH